jgi:nucleoside-diphosphate-sugar epimerase
MNELKGKTILVTGGAGYVGAGLLRALLAEGCQVVCVDKLMFGGEAVLDLWHNPNFRFYRGDISDAARMGAIFDSHAFYGVVHLAAIVGDPACKRKPKLATKTNWDASKDLVERTISASVPRFVFASTCSNYGKMADAGAYVDEESPLAPVSLYAELKVKFEQFLLTEIERRPGFSPTSLRFATVYGVSPRMRFDLTVNEFTKDLTLGKELTVFGEQFWRPYCHVRDFSRAFIATLKAPVEKVAYNVFNVGATEENYTKQMLVDEIKNAIPNASIRYVHKDEDPRDYRVNCDKIRRELGFEVSLRVPDGIREVKEVVESGVIANPEDQRYYNIPHKA